MKKNEHIPNVMRLLDQAKLPYTYHCYADTDAISGVEVAAVLKQPPERVFKTLVTVAKSGAHYVFVIPCAMELQLKRAAAAVGEKAIEMLKAKELLPLTGYIHGGCSPVGMKKPFRTVVHETAKEYPTICVSAGKIGYQVELAPTDLQKAVKFTYADISE